MNLSVKANIGYMKGLLKHKFWVGYYCIKLGVPFHIAVLHDVSKFSFIEWSSYVNNFYNKDGTKKEVRDATGAYDTNKQSDAFKMAWINHQRNKHHWQSWVNIGDRGVLSCVDIPEVYIKEMVADWCGAGISHSGKLNPKGWYEENKENMLLSKNSRTFLEEFLDNNF